MYPEDLVIDKAGVELVGEVIGEEPEDTEPNDTIVRGVAMTATGKWPLVAPNVEVIANGVVIHGFTFRGHDPAPGHYASGMVIGGNKVEIHDNIFEVTNSAAVTLDDVSQGLQTYSSVNNPVGTDFSGLYIHGNTFTSHGAGEAGYEAIYLNTTDTAVGAITISGNEFGGVLVRGITTLRSNVTISGNDMSTTLEPGDSLQAINVVGATAITISGNTIQSSDSGFTQASRVKAGASASISGNTLNVPSTEEADAGLPIRISDGIGVEGIDFELVFDPELLTITDAALGADVPSGWTVTVNDEDADAGLIRFSVYGDTALSGTNLEILVLTAEVPSTVEYRDSQVIRIGDLSLNDGAIASKADYAVHVAAYFGDASGNGIESEYIGPYSAYDAAILAAHWHPADPPEGSVPEPTTAALLTAGLMSLLAGCFGSMRRKRAAG